MILLGGPDPARGPQVTDPCCRCITPRPTFETCKPCNYTGSQDLGAWKWSVLGLISRFESFRKNGDLFLFLVVHSVSEIFDTISVNFCHVWFLESQQHRFCTGP